MMLVVYHLHQGELSVGQRKTVLMTPKESTVYIFHLEKEYTVSLEDIKNFFIHKLSVLHR
jgi:hypothetical protein